ncbi:hypothetical protein NM688_g596 [Phlebia brevispora]|uniref:Uncharacterized protein n=1 Tax=Phlebia brevispora TaxID=194682 RepID=A0ACC1TDN9_9APHY|nr:hypothetical protein NM688_g596 [Phlebia brevispora]
MALFPPTSPLANMISVRRPTSEYFLQEERAFFARAGKESVRVRAEADLSDLHENGELQQGDREHAGQHRARHQHPSPPTDRQADGYPQSQGLSLSEDHVHASPRLAPSQASLSEIAIAPATVPTTNTTMETFPFVPMNLNPSPQAPGAPLGGEEPSQELVLSHIPSHRGSGPYRNTALQEYGRTVEVPSTSSSKNNNPSRGQRTENPGPEGASTGAESVPAHIEYSSHGDRQHRVSTCSCHRVLTPAQFVFPVNLHLSPFEMVSAPGAPHPGLGMHERTGKPLQSQVSQQASQVPLEEAEVSRIAVPNQRRRSGKHTKRVFVNRL